MSNDLVCQITSGDLMKKPGWIRMSIHPTTTTEEITYVCNSIKELAVNHLELAKEYVYNPKSNEFNHQKAQFKEKDMLANWFSI